MDCPAVSWESVCQSSYGAGMGYEKVDSGRLPVDRPDGYRSFVNKDGTRVDEFPSARLTDTLGG